MVAASTYQSSPESSQPKQVKVKDFHFLIFGPLYYNLQVLIKLYQPD